MITLAYPSRLLCACLAAFFLVHLALGTMVSLLTPAALRLSRRMDAAAAACLLLALRLLPPAASLFIVLGLCVPSYLLLEVETGAERVGLACLAAASLALAVWAMSLIQAARAWLHSCRHARAWTLASHPDRRGLRLLDHPTGVLAVAGIFRPRIFVSGQVRDALTPEQLDAALAHEFAHGASCDNLKRLCLLLAPGLLPLWRGFGAIERAWARHAEWAADDAAAAGDPHRSLALAAALVHVARVETMPSLISAFDGGVDLSTRVDRLLRVEPLPTRPSRAPAFAATAMAAAAAALLTHPATFATVHRLLEHLIH